MQHDMNTIIDKFAFAGYDYAISGGKIPQIRTELELMAFNAGINNANIRDNLNVEKIKTIDHNKYHESIHRASHKELSTVWGQN
jgi:hypothetical protein